jgi:tRNA-dihydrouridine synthase
MRDLLPSDRPGLLLAPMQDITDLAFMQVMAARGGPDIYVTEYFRVHPDSRLEPDILRSVTENPTGRPVIAQMIGRDIPALVRTAKALEQHPVAGIDLNLGCPAPIVCRKDAGGALLRQPEHLDAILGALRDAVRGRFTVKTRVGYEHADEFGALVEIFRRHGIDALSIHARTVSERYQTPVHPEWVQHAVSVLPCPVIANGNVVDVATGLAYQQQTGAAGLMIGRGAIRNPWIFSQLKEAFAGHSPRPVTRADLLGYILHLSDQVACQTRRFDSHGHVNRMKKYLVFIAQGLDPEFEFQIRRVTTPAQFAATCAEFLSDDRPAPPSPPVNSKLFCGFGALLDPSAGH